MDGHTALATSRHTASGAPTCKAARIEATIVAPSSVTAVANTYILPTIADVRPILAAIEATPVLAAKANARATFAAKGVCAIGP